MKILVFSHNNHLYGANRSLLSVLLFLKNMNQDVAILLPSNGDFKDILDKLGFSSVKFFYFPFFLYYKLRLKYIALPFMWLWNILVFPVLLFKVKKLNPDIIYSNTAAENMGVLIAKILKIKHVWHIREFMDKDHGANFIGGNTLKSFFYNQSNGLIFVSNAVSDSITFHPNTKRKVIYNGISVKDFICKKRYDNFKSLKMGVVGVIDESKGQDKAISYFNDLLRIDPNAELYIFGQNGGFYLKYLKKLIIENDLTDKVIFKGFEKNISNIYDSIDVLLMTSRNEAFGRVTVEAMLHGVPVIGFNKGGTSELIDNGQTGFLFDNKDEFIEAFEELNNIEVYNYISEHARKNAVVQFSEERYTKEVLDFILTV